MTNLDVLIGRGLGLGSDMCVIDLTWQVWPTVPHELELCKHGMMSYMPHRLSQTNAPGHINIVV